MNGSRLVLLWCFNQNSTPNILFVCVLYFTNWLLNAEGKKLSNKMFSKIILIEATPSNLALWICCFVLWIVMSFLKFEELRWKIFGSCEKCLTRKHQINRHWFAFVKILLSYVESVCVCVKKNQARLGKICLIVTKGYC